MKDITSQSKLNAFLIAILPILGPYSITTGGVGIVDIILIMVIIVSAIRNRYFTVNKGLFYLLLFLGTISIFALVGTNSSRLNLILSLKVYIMFVIYTIGFGILCYNTDKEYLISVVQKIGILCATLAIFQFVFVSAGFDGFYSGRLPLPLNQYSAFGSLRDITGAVRVHSFFEEPSYLAIYELPIIIYSLQRKQYKAVVILSVGCALSGTMLGIAGLLVVFVGTLLLGETTSNQKIGIVALAIIAILAVIILYEKNASVHSMIDYYLYRYSKLSVDFTRDTSSVSQRIIGNLPLFNNYNVFNQIFGVGVNQYPVFFGLTDSYSNVVVTTLLNYGYLGIIALFVFAIRLFLRVEKSGIMQVILFVMIMCIDLIWFNEYFFYLIAWIIAFGSKDDTILLTMGSVRRKQT